MLSENFSSSHDLASSIAHDRYFLKSSHDGLQKLLLDLDDVLQNLEIDSAKQEVVHTLELVLAGVQHLTNQALEPSDFSNWKKTREHLLETVRMISSSAKKTEVDSLIVKIIFELENYVPTQTKKLSALTFDAVRRSLKYPAAASLFASLAIASGGKSAAENIPEKPVMHYHEVILDQPKKEVEDQGAAIELREKQEFIKKIKNKIATGKFSFEEYFNELESKFEKVTDEETSRAHIKFEEISKDISKNLSKLSDREFVKKVSSFAHSPKDRDDNRNTRASSNELLSERETVGNCEARARTTFRLIEKTRPELAAKVRVAMWRNHEALVYVDKAGDSYQMDAGTEWKIPKDILKKLPLRSPTDAWVNSFLNQEIGTGTERTNSSIKVQELNAPAMPSQETHRRSTPEIHKQEAEIGVEDLLNASTVDEGLIKVLSLSTKKMGDILPEENQAIINKLKNFHHVERFEFVDHAPEVELTSSETASIFHYDVAPIVEALRKMSIKRLVFMRMYATSYKLKDFSSLKQLTEVDLYGDFTDAKEVLDFLNEHEIQDLDMSSNIFSKIMEGDDKNIPESIKRMKTIRILENQEVQISDISKQLIALRTHGYLGNISIGYRGGVIDSSDRLEDFIITSETVDLIGAKVFTVDPVIKNISSYTENQLSRLMKLPNLQNVVLKFDGIIQAQDFNRLKKFISGFNTQKNLSISISDHVKNIVAISEITKLCSQTKNCIILEEASEPPPPPP
jgi:hypothetical protein